MPDDQLLIRDMAPKAGIKVQNIRLGRVGSHEFDKLFQASAEMRDLPLWIDDRSGLDVMQVWAAAHALKRRHKIGLIVVDYLQLVEGEGENRVAVVTDVTRKLKAMARTLGCHVLALSQLSRGVENRDDKRPHLSDLRESGSIEQDADVVLFLYRDDYYLAKQEPKQREGEKDSDYIDRQADYDARLSKCRGLAEIIVAKQRQGATPTIKARFDADRMSFHNLAREDGGLC
jgi:replicative DNA helicase